RRDPGNDTHGLLREKNVTVFSPAPATAKLGVRQYLDRAGRELDALELAARHEADGLAVRGPEHRLGRVRARKSSDIVGTELANAHERFAARDSDKRQIPAVGRGTEEV